MWSRKRGARGTGDLTAFIDEGSEIEGTCTFGGTVMLNGTIRGEMISTGTIIVGEKGAAQANLRAAAIVVSGHVTGDLVATQRIELRGAARVFGDIEAPVVVIEEGVLFEGRCQMTPRETSATTPHHDRSVVSLKR